MNIAGRATKSVGRRRTAAVSETSRSDAGLLQNRSECPSRLTFKHATADLRYSRGPDQRFPSHPSVFLNSDGLP